MPASTGCPSPSAPARRWSSAPSGSPPSPPSTRCGSGRATRPAGRRCGQRRSSRSRRRSPVPTGAPGCSTWPANGSFRLRTRLPCGRTSCSRCRSRTVRGLRCAASRCAATSCSRRSASDRCRPRIRGSSHTTVGRRRNGTTPTTRERCGRGSSGPYVDAAVRAGVAIDGALGALDEHLRDGGLGSVSETADGVAPHRPSGCPFQAWSVAEVLRARRRVVQLGG